MSAKEGMREKVTGHDAGVRVLARLIPMFGHRSKVEEGGWSHPDNLESLAPLKGLASRQAARLSATDKGQQFQKRVFAARAAAQGGWGGVAEKEQELLSNEYYNLFNVSLLPSNLICYDPTYSLFRSKDLSKRQNELDVFFPKFRTFSYLGPPSSGQAAQMSQPRPRNGPGSRRNVGQSESKGMIMIEVPSRKMFARVHLI